MREDALLKRLVVVNLLTSGGHFLHNAIFLNSYPGPLWIPGPGVVVAVWLVVATALVLGYRAHTKGRSIRAAIGISVFGVSCLAVFGHYLYGSPAHFDVPTNALILLEGGAGVTLLVYYFGFGRRPRR
jgi:hypothetical protein